MAILTFDTSSKACTVAIGTSEKLLIEYTLNLDYTHSEYLLPLIKQAAETAQIKLEDIEAIGVTCGPGSFTGLRIGLAVAKGLVVALNCPLYTFTSLEVLAASYWGVSEPVMTIISAQRGEVYAGLFDCSDGKPMLLEDYFIGKVDGKVSDVLASFPAFHLVGNAFFENEAYIAKIFGPRLKNTPYTRVLPSAASMLPLVLNAMENNKSAVDIRTIEPFYMRLSAAEQHRLEKEQRKNANQ